MRLSYSDEEDYPGQFGLWQGNCERSLRGAAGQKELRELKAALIGMASKRLIHGSLDDEDGGVCAIGAYAKHKGLDLSKYDPEEETDEVGIAAGMPRLVAWKVVEINDFEFDRHVSPEDRYTEVLAWVERKLLPAT